MSDGAIWTDIGPCQLVLGGVVLGKTVENPDGGTNGGTRVQIDQRTVQSRRDHSGEQAHDEIVSGTIVGVEANLAGVDVDQLASLIHGATIVNMPGGNKRIDIKSAVGKSLRKAAQELILKPLVGEEPTEDENEWFVFPLAAPKLNANIAFDLETTKVYAVMFAIFTDLTTGVIASVGQQSS